MGVKVFIIGLDDERLEIDLCDTEEQLKDITVLDLKRRIKDRKGISELEQVIVFAGKRLKDDRPLSDYGVKDLSTLHMVRQQEPGAGGSVGSDEDGGMGDKKGKNKRVIRSELGRSYKHTKTTEMGVKVFIFGLRGEKFTIDLCDTEEQLKDITVLDLKRRIKEREGIPEHDVRFVFHCLRLEDDRPLFDYGVKHVSVLLMIIRLPGSGSGPNPELGAGGSDGDGGMGDKNGKNKSKEKLIWF
ncbi:polyubiquitin isoform X2 [Larimichthys crocea]|uniref:polyubiquitin isoform X2 n=1 Tax=Larimichthys crocea TaxID=215358 RepID=UPI000F5F9AD8|nr:polyubiquitin isoform X2 [Larimichthys crocea]